jgi:hypothetical protein
MKIIIRAKVLGLVLGLASAACSSGAFPEGGSDDSNRVDSEQQALSLCKGACLPSCYCAPPSDHRCIPRCEQLLATGVMPASCGAADGCGGICTSGTCPPGGVCGGAGVPGSCAQPDLNPSLTGTVQPLGMFGHKGVFEVTLRNLGQVDASNAWVLFQTNLSGSLTSPLPAVPGFSCIELSGYTPRLGLKCVFATVPQNGTAAVELNLYLPDSGANVLSAFADPDNLIAELAENNNLASTTVVVP